ncbi:MAG: hypothetical protein Q9188_001383 [Gyalolechia gomerana]
MTDIAARENRAALAQIWRFICVERQLTKTDVLDTDIRIEITRMIQSAAAPMGLRVNSQLLLGLVRVYKQKVRFLLEDCDQTLTQIRLMRQRHAQISSTPATRTRSSSVIASPDMAFVSGAQSSPNCVSHSRRVADDVIIESDIPKADLESNIQAYIDDHNCERPKRTFAEMIQAELTEVSQPEHNYDSDYGDLDLDLDLGDSPLSIASPVMRSISCGSAGSPSPSSLYQDTQTLPEICNEPVDVDKSESQKKQKRRRTLAVKDQETVISVADLKKQQLNRSGILRPLAPRSAALASLQRTLADSFALSLVQGPRHCAPELRQYLNVDFIRANNAVVGDDAVDMTDTQLQESDSRMEDDLVSNESDYIPFEAWSDEKIQPFRSRLISAASSGTNLFQDVVSGLAAQDISECFLELLVLGTQGAVDIEQKTSFGDIWINQRSTC